nr:unnamed protein product [Digitaria exilis]
MRVPCCSLCNVRYDEDERTPLLLHCGHGFCRACLSRMLAAAPGATLPCPRCRHLTAVGNSVSALRKNFPILSLLSASPSSPSFLHSDSGSSSDGSDDEDDFFARPSRRPASAPAAAPPGCSSFDLASHPDLKLARRIGGGPPGPAGQEVWAGTLSRGGGAKRCKHQVAVKRVPLAAGEGLEGVQEEVERLRRASTWCRNVSTYHGAVRIGGHLCFVMDRYVGSVQMEMRQNGGRLTLEQILRYGADIARGVAELHAADYGLSAILKNLSSRRVPDDSGAGIDAALLSPNYTAPEAWGPLKKSLNMFWDSANDALAMQMGWTKCGGNLDFTNETLPNGIKPPTTSILEMVHDNPNALHHLVCEGDAAGVRSSSINSRLREGLGPTLAHVCAHHGQPECMQELLMAGADPNAVDGEGESVLHIAVARRYTDCAIVILENGGCRSMGIPNSQHKTWVEVASLEEIAEAIDVPSPVGTALCMAAALKKEHEKEGRELVRILLAAGADPTAQDDPHCRTALHTAAMIDDVELVKIILEAGVDVNIRNAQNTTPLHVALNRGFFMPFFDFVSLGIVLGLFRSIAMDDDGDNAFHIAADAAKMIRENLTWVVQMLQQPSPAVDVRNHRYEVADWVKFRRTVTSPAFGWQEAGPRSIGFVQSIVDNDHLVVSFCTGEARVLTSEVIKVIPLNRGQHVQLKPDVSEPRFGWRGQSRDSIGTVLCVDDDGILRVGFPGASRGWRADPAEIERVEEYKIGDQVCVKRSVAEPRYAWGGETHHSVGKIIDIESDGLLIIDIPNRAAPWQADPSDMEKIENFKVGDWVRVKATVPSPKYGWEDVTHVEKAQPFEVGEKVHVSPSISEPRLGWLNETAATIGAIARIDMDGTLNIKVSGRKNLWKVAPGDAERLSAFEVGDWVRQKPSIGSRPTYDWNSIGRISIAVVHSIQDSGYLELAGCFRNGKWLTHNTDIEKVQPFKIGQHVRFRAGISEPRWGWRDARPESRGIIAGVHADGEVRVAFFGVPGLWRGDPGDLEIEQIFEVGEWVRLRNDANQWKSLRPGSIGVVHGVGYEGDVWDGTIHVAFCGEQERWIGPSSQLEGVSKFVVGQRVRIRGCIRQPRFGWSNHNHASIGTISSIDADGKLRIHTPAGARAWLIDPAEVEKVVEEEEICVGDWVKVKDSVATPTYQWGDVNHNSIGVVHRADDGELWIAFCFCERLWLCKAWEVEKVRPFRQGDRVRIRPGLVSPRWGWGMETYASKGEVVGVDANGKLRIKFRWRDRLWIGDPADIVLDDSALTDGAAS